MATNSIDSNGLTESIDENELMDHEKPSIDEEVGEKQPTESPNLAGPMTLLVCIRYIILSCMNATTSGRTSVYLDDILEILSSNNADFDNGIDKLQELVKEYFLNLYVCIINQNEKSFYCLNDTSEQESQQWPRAYLVFDKCSRSFYPFYIRNNNKKYTTFPVNDTHTMRLFEDLVDSYNWPHYSRTIQKSPDHDISDEEENASTTNVNRHTVNADNLSENVGVSPKRFKPNDTNEGNATVISVNVGDPVIGRTTAPNDEETGTFTNASIVAESSLSRNLPKLELLNQPKRFWHNREPKTVGKGCPAVQVEGAPQRTPLQLGLSEQIRDYEDQCYIGTHVKTYNGNEHTQKHIVPKTKKDNKNQSLKFNEQEVFDECDLTAKGAFSKIQPNDLKNLQKELTIWMFNFKQDEKITKIRIKEDKLIWCRLMFAIYIKSSDGQFKRVSPPIYSDLIKETHGSQSSYVETDFPDKFCERGGQMIFIQLNESVEKCNLRVHCNGKVLDDNDYQIAETILSFESPVCIQGRKNLEIIIDKQGIKDWITFTRPYHQHDDHPEPCGVINQD